MRLIAHNMLKCNIKGVKEGFPLGIEVVKVEERELEFNSGNGSFFHTAGEQHLH